MLRRPPGCSRTATLFPDTALVRSGDGGGAARRQPGVWRCRGDGLVREPPVRRGGRSRFSRSTDANGGKFGPANPYWCCEPGRRQPTVRRIRSEEHTSELQVTNAHLVCRLLLEKKKTKNTKTHNVKTKKTKTWTT